jgi:transcription elongation GreA/GreB family factor
MIEQLTKQEISQIKQEIESLASELRDKRGGARLSPADRQIATNAVAKTYGMTGIELARIVSSKSWRAVKEQKQVTATAQQMIEQMSQKHAAELEALRLAIAEVEKPKPIKADNGFYKGHHVSVYNGKKGNPESFRIVGRGNSALHVAYISGLTAANKVAANVDRLVNSILGGVPEEDFTESD